MESLNSTIIELLVSNLRSYLPNYQGKVLNYFPIKSSLYLLNC